MLKIIVRSFFPDWKPETLQGVSQVCTSLNKVLIDKVPFHRCVLESRQSRPTWRPASTPPPTSARRAERRWCCDRRHCCCRCGRRRWDLCVGNAVLRRRWRRRLGSMTRHFFAVTDVSTPPPGILRLIFDVGYRSFPCVFTNLDQFVLTVQMRHFAYFCYCILINLKSLRLTNLYQFVLTEQVCDTKLLT